MTDVLCSCNSGSVAEGEESLTALERIRVGCPAIRLILLPDSAWPAFKHWHAHADPVAWHRSIVLLALERGHLSRVTSPLHRFLLAGDRVAAGVSRQYRKDFVENWVHQADAVERHRKSKIFRGRLTELQFAMWLETRGWAVTGLEALGAGSDIEAVSELYGATAFEVKFIGADNDEFRAMLRSIAGQNSGRMMSAYNGLNYVLFRLFEAAKQLETVELRRARVIVIEDLAWSGMELPLENSWIDWASPQFLFPDSDWKDFMATQESRFSNIANELGPTLGRLDSAWIVRESSFDFTLEFDLQTRST